MDVESQPCDAVLLEVEIAVDVSMVKGFCGVSVELVGMTVVLSVDAVLLRCGNQGRACG